MAKTTMASTHPKLAKLGKQIGGGLAGLSVGFAAAAAYTLTLHPQNWDTPAETAEKYGYNAHALRLDTEDLNTSRVYDMKDPLAYLHGGLTRLIAIASMESPQSSPFQGFTEEIEAMQETEWLQAQSRPSYDGETTFITPLSAKLSPKEIINKFTMIDETMLKDTDLKWEDFAVAILIHEAGHKINKNAAGNTKGFYNCRELQAEQAVSEHRDALPAFEIFRDMRAISALAKSIPLTEGAELFDRTHQQFLLLNRPPIPAEQMQGSCTTEEIFGHPNPIFEQSFNAHYRLKLAIAQHINDYPEIRDDRPIGLYFLISDLLENLPANYWEDRPETRELAEGYIRAIENLVKPEYLVRPEAPTSAPELQSQADQEQTPTAGV